MPLPPTIVVKATENRYVLLSVQPLAGDLLSATMVEGPKDLFQEGEWRMDGIEEESQDYNFLHKYNNGPAYIETTSTMIRTKLYVKVPWSDPIYVYTMTRAIYILQDEFYTVYGDEDTDERWHFKLPFDPIIEELMAPLERPPRILPFSDPDPAPAPAPVPPLPSAPSAPSDYGRFAQIPPHIFRAFVSSSIEKLEVCPILLEPFTSIEESAMTPCGHLFDKKSLISSLRIKSSCPTCRERINVGQIQTIQ